MTDRSEERQARIDLATNSAGIFSGFMADRSVQQNRGSKVLLSIAIPPKIEDWKEIDKIKGTIGNAFHADNVTIDRIDLEPGKFIRSLNQKEIAETYTKTDRGWGQFASNPATIKIAENGLDRKDLIGENWQSAQIMTVSIIVPPHVDPNQVAETLVTDYRNMQAELQAKEALKIISPKGATPTSARSSSPPAKNQLPQR